MKNKSLSLVVGLLVLGFCPSLLHADGTSWSVEVGASRGRLSKMPTDIHIETTPGLEFNFDPNAEESASFISAYSFLGIKVLDLPSITGTLEAMLMYSLSSNNSTDRNYAGLEFPTDVEPTFYFEGAYGVGGKLSFQLEKLEPYARAGYGNFYYWVEQGRLTRIRTRQSTRTSSSSYEAARVDDLEHSSWGLYFGGGIQLSSITFGYYYLPEVEKAHVFSIGYQFF